MRSTTLRWLRKPRTRAWKANATAALVVALFIVVALGVLLLPVTASEREEYETGNRIARLTLALLLLGLVTIWTRPAAR